MSGVASALGLASAARAEKTTLAQNTPVCSARLKKAPLTLSAWETIGLLVSRIEWRFAGEATRQRQAWLSPSFERVNYFAKKGRYFYVSI